MDRPRTPKDLEAAYDTWIPSAGLEVKPLYYNGGWAFIVRDVLGEREVIRGLTAAQALRWLDEREK